MTDEKDNDPVAPDFSTDSEWVPSELEMLDRPPVEVFEAIDGNRQALANCLKSAEPLSLYTRDAIAAWMAGELPPKRKRGNPHGTRLDRNWNAMRMYFAELEYKQLYLAAGRPQKQSDGFSKQVAEKWGIHPDTFRHYRRRSKLQRHEKPETLPLLEEMWWDWKANIKSKK